jgi:hypothetical protein
MKKIPIHGMCEVCHTKKATQRHEKFPQSKINLRLYGDLIYHRDNTLLTCSNCNTSHAGKAWGLTVWGEREFCEAMGIVPRSKTLQAKIKFGRG